LTIGDGHALHPDGEKGVADFLEFEGFDDGGDEFHVMRHSTPGMECTLYRQWSRHLSNLLRRIFAPARRPNF
jgi:hypothetical protein